MDSNYYNEIGELPIASSPPPQRNVVPIIVVVGGAALVLSLVLRRALQQRRQQKDVLLSSKSTSKKDEVLTANEKKEVLDALRKAAKGETGSIGFTPDFASRVEKTLRADPTFAEEYYRLRADEQRHLDEEKRKEEERKKTEGGECNTGNFLKDFACGFQLPFKWLFGGTADTVSSVLKPILKPALILLLLSGTVYLGAKAIQRQRMRQQIADTVRQTNIESRTSLPS